MKKVRFQILQKFNQLYREFHQSYNEEDAKKLLNFFQDTETFAILKQYARHNPHRLTHQNFETDWEVLQISLKNWISGKVDISVPFKLLDDIKIWIT